MIVFMADQRRTVGFIAIKHGNFQRLQLVVAGREDIRATADRHRERINLCKQSSI